MTSGHWRYTGPICKPALLGVGPRQYGDFQGRSADFGFGVALLTWSALQHTAGAAITTTAITGTVATGGVVGSSSSTTLKTSAAFDPGNGTYITIRSETMQVIAGSGTTTLTVIRSLTPITTIAVSDAITVPNSWASELAPIQALGIPYRVRVLLGINSPQWAKLLGTIGPITICDPGDGTLIYTCPAWWDPLVKAAFDDLCTKLAVLLEGDPNCREIAIHFAETIYGEPMQRGSGTSATVAATGVNAGKNNAQVFTEAGLNGGSSTAPDPTDAATVLYPSDIMPSGLTRWASYGFKSTLWYAPENPIQSWNPTTFTSITDPGNWTENVFDVIVAANMGAQAVLANNSARIPIAALGSRYATMFAAEAASTISTNAFQTATISIILSSYQTVGATVTNKAANGTTATLTFSAPHGRINGEVVLIQGVDATFNGTRTLTAVTSTTVQYALASTVTSTSATGWMATTSQAEALKATLNVYFGLITSASDPLGLILSPVTALRAKSVELPTGWHPLLTAGDCATYLAAGTANLPTARGSSASNTWVDVNMLRHDGVSFDPGLTWFDWNATTW